MAVVATKAEIQVLLQIDDKDQFISDMIPIIQSTIDSYFDNSSWAVDGYPVSLKRPTAMLVQQMLENPGAVWREEIGTQETEFRGVDLSKIFSGLENLKTNKTAARAQFINLQEINENLGI
ncbi:hypothetical protein KAR91_20670 [Candidatus Pacearchaeota archaeon]|nr:hypothetical protein [Candidatus Pacearchaeota archaeon]